MILMFDREKLKMKGVIPAAGLGTRMLPATKSQPKEMLPVARKPVIQYIVEELEKAGVKDILIITGKNKRAIDDHFDKDPVMLNDLKNRNKFNQVKFLEELENLNIQILYTRQAIPTGLADAVYKAKEFVGKDDFVVALGDTIIDSIKNPIHLQKLINFHKQANALCTISTEQIPIKYCDRYGILDVTPYNSTKNTVENHHYNVKNLIEKPTIDKAPSNLAICGRYVFKPAIFDCIEKIDFGKGGEKQLTDAMIKLLEIGNIVALKLTEKEIRYDTGTFPLYAKAFLAMCLKDEEIGPELIEYIKKLNL
ncbi:MAG: UTP--glucose-1-phosphate uridylyltransferase [Candidatus Heimdallarchaeota archaeon]|nr:UTP--glucose-1-phosphate uridylyltransferase [Candidatus Heimdallarchaeota archaeon]